MKHPVRSFRPKLFGALAPALLLVLMSCQTEPARPAAETEEAAPEPATQEMARTPAPAGAEVYLIAPEDGAVVSSPVVVKFGLRGLGVAPAGIEVPNTGHHHLLIDLDELPSMDQPIPADSNHVHFGGGQTETTVELQPGTHTLQLLVGDRFHIPHDPPIMSQRITITVE